MHTDFLSGKDIQKKIVNSSLQKTEASAGRLFLLAVLAGLYIALGAQFFLAALAGGMGKVVGGLVFSTGLVLVVLAGAELFTGNMTIISGIMAGKISGLDVLRNWAIVYAGNFIGSVLLVLLVFYSGLTAANGQPNELGGLTAGIALAKLDLPFMQAFLRGVLCNILVVLAVIMASGARTAVSKIACIMLPIGCFVACGFEHSVANMYLIPLGLLNDGSTFFGTFAAFKNILPVTLGNMAGGLAIVLVHPSTLKLYTRRRNGKTSRRDTD